MINSELVLNGGDGSVITQVNTVHRTRAMAIAATTARFAGKRVRLSLHRRGIFRNCVDGVCSVSPLGDVAITAETTLTRGRRCVSLYELGANEVAAMVALQSSKHDFSLQLELNSIEWRERAEKIPIPLVRRSISTYRFWHRGSPKEESLVSGGP